MASANDRFLIRDYAAKMRIIDLKKSWPFAGVKNGTQSLPPISISRFRWWADELRPSGSNSKAFETTTDKLVEGPESVQVIKEGTEECELRSANLARSRTRKKRSIVELFASASQIDPVMEQLNVEDNDGKCKDKEETENRRKRAGKRRKGGIKMGISALKKDKLFKPKMLSLGHSHLLQDSNHSITLQKTDKNAIEGKKLPKTAAWEKKHNTLQKPNLKSKNQKTLKRKKRYISTKKELNSNTRDSCNKRSSINLPQFKSLYKIFSDVLGASSSMNNSTSKVQEILTSNASTQVKRMSERSSNEEIVDKKAAFSSQKNQLCFSSNNAKHGKVVDSSNSSCSTTGKASVAAGMIDLNNAIEGCNRSAKDLSFKCTNLEDQIHPPVNLSKIAVASITNSTFNTVDLLATMKNPSLIVCSDRNEGQFDGVMNSMDGISMNSLLSCSMGSDKLEGSVISPNLESKRKIKRAYKDFISLPLNMQRRASQMHPGINYVASYKKQNRDNHDIASCQKAELDWYQNEYHTIRERVGHELSFTEFIGPKRLNSHNNEPFKGEYEVMNSNEGKSKLYFDDGKADYATQDFKIADMEEKCNLSPQFEPVVQPTIRLMGQNVVIGDYKRASHSPIMTENYSSNQMTNCSSAIGNLLNLSNSPSIFYGTTEHIVPQIAEDNRLELLHKTLLNKAEEFFKSSDSGDEYVGQRLQYFPFVAGTFCKQCQNISCNTLAAPLEKLPQWLLQAKHQWRNQPSSSDYPYLNDLNYFNPHPSSHALASNSSKSSLNSVVTTTNAKEREVSCSNFKHFSRFGKLSSERDDVSMHSVKRQFF